MKKYLYFTVYLLSVAVLFFAVDFVAGLAFDRYLFLKNDPKLKYAFDGGEGEQIIILGASRASHHYVPSVFKEKLGMNSFNYGMDGRNILNQYVVASLILNGTDNKPLYALLDVDAIDIDNTPGWNDEKLSNLYTLYKKDNNVKEIIDKSNQAKGNSLQISNLYRYNSQLISLVRNSIIVHSPNFEYNGYKPLYAKWEKEIDYISSEGQPSVYPLKEYYLRKLLDEYSRAGVKVLVFVSPDYELYSNPSGWEDRIATICKSFDVPFFNHSHDSIFMEHKEWFNEPFHLNDNGAIVYSSVVSQDIKEYIDFCGVTVED